MAVWRWRWRSLRWSCSLLFRSWSCSSLTRTAVTPNLPRLPIAYTCVLGHDPSPWYTPDSRSPFGMLQIADFCRESGGKKKFVAFVPNRRFAPPSSFGSRPWKIGHARSVVVDSPSPPVLGEQAYRDQFEDGRITPGMFSPCGLCGKGHVFRRCLAPSLPPSHPAEQTCSVVPRPSPPHLACALPCAPARRIAHLTPFAPCTPPSSHTGTELANVLEDAELNLGEPQPFFQFPTLSSPRGNGRRRSLTLLSGVPCRRLLSPPRERARSISPVIQFTEVRGG